MNFIERAVQDLERAEQARREGRLAPVTRADLNDDQVKRDFVQVDTEPAAANTNDTDEALRESDGIPVLAPQSVTAPDADSAGLNPIERNRRQTMQALRERIDQVEASDEQADVSMPAAPVRATRAAQAAAGLGGATGLAGAGGAGGDAGREKSRRDARSGDVASLLKQEPTLRAGLGSDSAALVAGQSPEPRLAARQGGAESAETPREVRLDGRAGAGRAERDNAADGAAKPAPESPAAGVGPAESTEEATPAADGGSAIGAIGSALRLHPIRGASYLDFSRRADPMRTAFETVSEDLLDMILAGDPGSSTARRVLVTSAHTGEGRSLCSMHLALSLATDQEVPVVWVDADFTGEPLLPRLGVREGLGLADWLTGRVRTLGAVLVPSGLNGLRVVGAGSHDGLAAMGVRLDQAALHAFLLELSRDLPDHVIVLNAPSMLAGGPTAQMAMLCGQVLLVVAADETRRTAVKQALVQLERHASVSLLLNKVAA